MKNATSLAASVGLEVLFCFSSVFWAVKFYAMEETGVGSNSHFRKPAKDKSKPVLNCMGLISKITVRKLKCIFFPQLCTHTQGRELSSVVENMLCRQEVPGSFEEGVLFG